MKLILNNLTKSFGEKAVLKNINFVFSSSKIYALLGKNGAGKTTLFNCMDDLTDYEGSFSLDKGEELTSFNLGYIPNNLIIPEFLTGKEFINYFISLHQIKDVNIEEYLKLIDLSKEDYAKLIKEYSLGMKQKLQILAYLILKPQVLLLDEPLVNIDIITAKEIKNLLKKIKKNRIIIVSTHILELAKSMCDDIVVLSNGKLTLIDKNLNEEKIMEVLK